jgi:hypothetical protein
MRIPINLLWKKLLPWQKLFPWLGRQSLFQTFDNEDNELKKDIAEIRELLDDGDEQER